MRDRRSWSDYRLGAVISSDGQRVDKISRVQSVALPLQGGHSRSVRWEVEQEGHWSGEEERGEVCELGKEETRERGSEGEE